MKYAEPKKAWNFKDLTGQKFGRLTVISHEGTREYNNGAKRATWLCECECGKTKSFASSNLRAGNSLSCGCLHLESSITNLKSITVDAMKESGIKNRKDGTPLRNFYLTYIHSAKRRDIFFDIDFDTFARVVSQNCSLCDAEPKVNLSNFKRMKSVAKKTGRVFYEEYHQSQIPKTNGIDRINPEIGYIESNIQPLCAHCNYGKAGFEQQFHEKRNEANEAFIAHCFRVVEHLKSKQLNLIEGETA